MKKILFILCLLGLFLISGCTKSNSEKLPTELNEYAIKNSDFDIIKVNILDCIENSYADVSDGHSIKKITYSDTNPTIPESLKTKKFPESMDGFSSDNPINESMHAAINTQAAINTAIRCLEATKTTYENTSATDKLKYDDVELYSKYKQIMNYTKGLDVANFMGSDVTKYMVQKNNYYLFTRLLFPQTLEYNLCDVKTATHKTYWEDPSGYYSIVSGYVDENNNVYITGVTCVKSEPNSTKMIEGTNKGYVWNEEIFPLKELH